MAIYARSAHCRRSFTGAKAYRLKKSAPKGSGSRLSPKFGCEARWTMTKIQAFHKGPKRHN
jgi:hypothetical protein